MNNKAMPESSNQLKRGSRRGRFEINLTSSQKPASTPLTYSISPSQPRMINLQHLPHKDQMYPPTVDFLA
jgi:hypothetical protein